MPAKKNNFESNLERLKDIVDTLDDNEITLDQSLKLFEEGIKLYRKCNDTIDKAEQKITILIEENEKLVEKEYNKLED
ncbi:MAG: exodeoxyribonuclease VII small subunit [Acidaminobacteraceae bacterium]